jgi:hypothetical protein
MPRTPLAVPHWVISALLLGILVVGVAAALLLIPEAQRPTLEPAPSSSSTR